MNINLQIIDVGDDGKVYWLKVVALTTEGKVVDRDIFRFPKQTKRILTNPPPDPSNPPDGWKPKLSVPRECNIFSYELLADIATRHFLRRQGLLEKGGAWKPAGWTKQEDIDIVLPPEEERQIPFLAGRLVDMLGAKLLVDAPDIAGVLEGVKPKPGTVTTISTNYDGYATDSPSCAESPFNVFIGNDVSQNNLRGWVRFDLGTLTGTDVVTDVDLKVNVVTGRANVLIDVQAYNQDGQADPNSDNCTTTRYTRMADDASPYLNNDTFGQSSGIKTLQLPVVANADVEAAKDAVDRFSLGLNEDGTAATGDNRTAAIEGLASAGADECKLVLTHVPSGGAGAVV